MPQLCIVDPGIADWNGHHAEYALSLVECARTLGWDCTVFARQGFEPSISNLLNGQPTFRNPFWHRPLRRPRLGALLNPVLANWDFYQDLQRATRTWGQSSWVVLMPTIDHHQMFAWAWWLRRLQKTANIQLILLFRYSYYFGNSSVPADIMASRWFRAGARALRPFIRRGQVRLATDSDRLAAQYARLTGCSFEVLPIPHTADIASMGKRNGARDAPHRSRFVSLGDPRAEKGFGIIAQAIQRLALYAPQQIAGMEFVLQGGVHDAAHTPMLKYTRALKHLGLENISFVETVLDRTQYLELLHLGDVVLLPYSPAIYYARTSGPFTEALAAGKPVISSEGTWMADQLTQHGAGITFFEDDVDDFVRALLAARDQRADLLSQAAARQGEWLDYHNPRRFLSKLVAG